MYDLCIIGGGAAGVSAAIKAAKRGKKVVLVEKNSKLCKKLYATGNGRCNITNTKLDIKASEEYADILSKVYNSSNKHFVDYIMSWLGANLYKDIMDFVKEIGVETKEINGYVYPESLQASAFVWALIDALKKYDVEIVLKATIKEILKKDGCFCVKLADNNIVAKKLLIATGGKSYKSLGGDDFGYGIAKSFSHSIIKVRPSLCGIVTDENLKEVSGVRASGKATLYDKNNICYGEEYGELQLTDSGISGIMIFNLSSKCGELLCTDKKPYICLDFIPERSVQEIVNSVRDKGYRTILGNMNSFVNDKLASRIIKDEGYDPGTITDKLEDADIFRLVSQFKKYIFNVNKLRDYESAQVCAGGVEISELDSNFMSNIIDDLYFAGEVIDIDGVCGGYNITFAILSGIKVGLSI